MNRGMRLHCVVIASWSSLARWIATERSPGESKPVDVRGQFEGWRKRSGLGRRVLPRVSRADEMGAPALLEQCRSWAGGAFTGRQLPTPEMPGSAANCIGLREVEHLPPVLRGVRLVLMSRRVWQPEGIRINSSTACDANYA